ncbi:MAG: type II toxin-antitoxin system RelE/ParE family toxin [Elusimicrobiota bacterium]
MNIEILKIAHQEFKEAQEFYEIEQTGLGRRFETEIKHSLMRVIQYPSAWPFECKEIHRYFVHKFPYKILYSIQEDKVIILAFAHLHRKPNYWIARIK